MQASEEFLVVDASLAMCSASEHLRAPKDDTEVLKPPGGQGPVVTGSAVPRDAAGFTPYRIVNGLLHAVRIAFSFHRPLRLRPDDFAQAVCTSLGAYVKSAIRADDGKAATVLRAGHGYPPADGSGKVSLEVLVSPEWEARPELVEWEAVLASIKASMAHALVPGLADAFTLGPYGTTTDVDTTSRTVACMSGFQDVFEYSMRTKCGISKVWLQGRPEDWQRLRADVQGIADRLGPLCTREIRAWLARLDPLLEEMARTKLTGVANPDFWSRIYKIDKHHGSGSVATLTGWLLQFFPFDARGERRRDPESNRMAVEDTPAGYSSVPFHWTKLSGEREQFTLYAGHWQVAAYADGSVAPLNQWVVLRRGAGPGAGAPPRSAVLLPPKPAALAARRTYECDCDCDCDLSDCDCKCACQLQKEAASVRHP